MMHCASSRIFTPNPPASGDVAPKKQKKRLSQPEKKAPDEIDFSEAFEDTGLFRGKAVSMPDSGIHTRQGVSAVSIRYPVFPVNRRLVRVALRQNVTRTTVYSVGYVSIRASGLKAPLTFRGRLSVAQARASGSVMVTGGSGGKEISLPCTLASQQEYNFAELEQESYRGNIILIKDKPGAFTVVNELDVEEYLRGVVPLEIGKRPAAEIEALKAQAIAARTYTYERIQSRREQLYDLVATVADQVYGGANAEFRETDLAIKLTRDLIMTHNGAIVTAYYHSTCGGRTANIEQVWNKPATRYLSSIADIDSQGAPYCSISTSFAWEEKWPMSEISSIIGKNAKTISAESHFKGNVKDIVVLNRFPCGRIKSCRIIGSGDTVECGGDKIRFLLRRNNAEKSILRSAQFKVVSVNHRGVAVSGSGYGHGVGMCQMGAVGRARAGQSFEQILKAYYTGIMMCQVGEGR